MAGLRLLPLLSDRQTDKAGQNGAHGVQAFGQLRRRFIEPMKPMRMARDGIQVEAELEVKFQHSSQRSDHRISR
jgi:hypothetical protein